VFSDGPPAWLQWSLRMLKKIGIGVLIVVIFIMMLWFTSNNPGVVEIDLAFGVIQPSIPVAFSVTFVIGWAFGLFCTGIFMFRIINERRRLRRALRNTESEISSLRNLPLTDAD
jgi:uncharacterized membrane protein YciS (DUF1049 family)